jgi:DNA-binding beta-propeller fold protein YncE
VKLPNGAPGIGFDDLRYSKTLHRVLVPAGRSGRLDLVDPESLAVTSIAGFSSKAGYSGGHDDGPTSVEEALGKLYVSDRTSQKLLAVDPGKKSIVSTTPLASGPDYVRFVEATNELWVTEPSSDQIEIFSLGADGTPTPSATIPVNNGPESLVIDARRGRAYTHRWQRSTLAIDVKTRAIAGEWQNRCESSRGIALDETHGWLFAACLEGTVTVLDVDHDGKILSTVERGSGFDVVGYSAALGHLYLAGDACACVVILGVKQSGKLEFLERLSAPSSTHCAAADDAGNAWVCDPDGGQLFRVHDRNPKSN